MFSTFLLDSFMKSFEIPSAPGELFVFAAAIELSIRIKEVLLRRKGGMASVGAGAGIVMMWCRGCGE